MNCFAKFVNCYYFPYMGRKIPSVLPKFEDMLDEAITLAEHDINDVDCEIKLDYKVLIPNKVGSADPGKRGCVQSKQINMFVNDNMLSI